MALFSWSFTLCCTIGNILLGSCKSVNSLRVLQTPHVYPIDMFYTSFTRVVFFWLLHCLGVHVYTSKLAFILLAAHLTQWGFLVPMEVRQNLFEGRIYLTYSSILKAIFRILNVSSMKLNAIFRILWSRNFHPKRAAHVATVANRKFRKGRNFVILVGPPHARGVYYYI